MRTLLMASAIAIMAAPASAGTIKAVWNQPLDYPANVEANARLTSVDECLGRAMTFDGHCYNDDESLEPPEDEEDEEDEEPAA